MLGNFLRGWFFGEFTEESKADADVLLKSVSELLTEKVVGGSSSQLEMLENGFRLEHRMLYGSLFRYSTLFREDIVWVLHRANWLNENMRLGLTKKEVRQVVIILAVKRRATAVGQWNWKEFLKILIEIRKAIELLKDKFDSPLITIHKFEVGTFLTKMYKGKPSWDGKVDSVVLKIDWCARYIFSTLQEFFLWTQLRMIRSCLIVRQKI